jgi:ComF family protein
MGSLLELMLPPACAGCGRPGGLLCDACRGRLRVPSTPQDRFLVPDGGVVIGDALALAMAAFTYDGPLRRALAALKYTGVARLAPILASAAAPRLAELLAISGDAALVPIPVHRDRRRERGYNQAELLAVELGRSLRLPVVSCLERRRPTTKQHRLSRTARLVNLRGAFSSILRPPPIVILVDDIITTTATLEACASVLREAGCETVYGFAIAREI